MDGVCDPGPPQEIPGGGYDRPPRDSEAIGLNLVGGDYMPNRVVDPFGFEWSHHPTRGWFPTAKYLRHRATHTWGTSTHER